MAACGDDDDVEASDAPAGADDTALRLGYFPNLTHAPALVSLERGFLEGALGGSELETKPFNAGPEAVEALFSGALDASFIGPNPAVNAFAQSDGKAIRIVGGSTSGGAFLIVKPGIDKAADLKDKTLATPQLGNTQDVALRAWLEENGLEADTSGGGDVSIKPQQNADTLTSFQQGTVDGAWVPEPWATRLLDEGGGKVLVDERDLWPDGEFVTTHLIVRTEFLEDHPAVVKRLLEGLVESIRLIEDDPEAAKQAVNAGIEAIAGKPLPEATIDKAWENLTFTWDPIASSLEKSKDAAVEVGLLEAVELDGIYDLSLLNEVLQDEGEESVEGP